MKKRRPIEAGSQLLLAAALAGVAVVQIVVAPADSWLQSGSSQALVAILQRLQSPGLLSRDLVTAHPHVTFTAYDEATLFLGRFLHVPLKLALQLQQTLFHFGALLGCYLLLRSLALSRVASALVAVSVVVVGCALFRAHPYLMDWDPTPHSFAFDLILLSAGLLANTKPLLGGLAGGLAVIYDARITAPLVLVLLVAFTFDASVRKLFRPVLLIIVIFSLLLANLAQLQPSPVETRDILDRIPAAIARIHQFRSPWIWVGSWSAAQFFRAFGLCLLAGSGMTVLWDHFNRQVRWMLIGLPLLGLAGIAVSGLSLDRLRLSIFLQLQLPSWLVFDAELALLICGASVAVCLKRARPTQAILFGAACFLVLVSAGDLKRDPGSETHYSSLVSLSTWAETSTWGGSMFLFPDAGNAWYPGAFRALAKRAVWVDWATGSQGDYSESFADEWWRRWQDTMEEPFTPAKLPRLLTLPIDYYVLKSRDALADVKPVFATAEFVVYDADDLRTIAHPLHLRQSS